MNRVKYIELYVENKLYAELVSEDYIDEMGWKFRRFWWESVDNRLAVSDDLPTLEEAVMWAEKIEKAVTVELEKEKYL